MKIAIVVPGFPVISETFIVNHITGLIDHGHDVTVIALRKNIIAQQHKIIVDYNLLERTVFVRQIPSPKALRRICAVWLSLKYGLRFPVKMCRAWRYLLLKDRSDFYQKLYFLFAVLNRNHDIFHFHFAQTGRLGATLKKMRIPMKMVTSLHGADVNQVPQQKGEHYYADLFRFGDHFIANTEFTKTQALNLGCNSHLVSVIPVGLYLRDFPFRPRTIMDNETVRILTVGRLVEKKGLQYSIQAISLLIKEGYKIHYTIAGEGPLRDELEHLTQTLQITQSVSFTGELTQEKVIHLYNESHLFVLSSVTAQTGDKEGQALVLQEAQACGLPVVSTHHNGIPDGVLDGQSGYLVPEKDIDALANAVRTLIKNPDSWCNMGVQGRQFVEKKYDIHVVNKRVVELYEKIKKSSFIQGGLS